MSIQTQVLTLRYRALPSKSQHAALARILEDQRQLYNAALEERIGCYRRTGQALTLFDQFKSLTQCRAQLKEMAALPLALQRATIKRLDLAYASFFRRIKAGERAGFPRFKGALRFTSFGFDEFHGLTLKGSRIRFKGLPGSLRINLHRPMPDNPSILSCQFRLRNHRWEVTLQVKAEAPEKRIVSRAVGIDMGLATLAALSDGVLVQNPRVARKAERKVRTHQRALTRCKRGSARRKKVKAELARLYAKITNTRRTYLHQQSAMLVRNYALIAIEALNIKGLANGALAHSVRDAAWGTFINFLRYKAERAGAYLIEVDPRGTSQTCPECGSVEKKALAERVHNCPCGYVADRDVAAAREILNRAVVGPGWHNVTHTWGERATRNLGFSVETLPSIGVA